MQLLLYTHYEYKFLPAVKILYILYFYLEILQCFPKISLSWIVEIFSVAEWIQRCKGHATGILCGRYLTPAVVLVSYHYLIAAVNQTGDRYADLISVPGGSSLQTFVLSPTLLYSNKHKKSLKALFLNFQTFY